MTRRRQRQLANVLWVPPRCPRCHSKDIETVRKIGRGRRYAFCRRCGERMVTLEL